MRRALVKLKGLAERTGCAVLCVRHWRKGTSETALYRGGGSIGFIAAARAGHVVGYAPDDETKTNRVFACSKMNLAPLPPSMSFKLVVEPGTTFPRIRWQGASPHGADALSGATKVPSAVDEAVAFLNDRIGSDEVPVKEIQDEARAEGHSLRSLRRAKEDGGFESVKDPTGAFWVWRRVKVANDSPSPGNGHLPRESAADLGHLREKGRLPRLGDAAEPERGRV